MRWHLRLRYRVFTSYLRHLHAYTQGRIDNGDLDFDDWIYRTRDASATLIEITERLNK